MQPVFRDRLGLIGSRIEGLVALCLVDADGIVVEALEHGDTLDLEGLAAELLAQVARIGRDYHELTVGRVQQFAVTSSRYIILLTAVGSAYYLLAVLDRRESYGRARFELRRARLLFLDDLD